MLEMLYFGNKSQKLWDPFQTPIYIQWLENVEEISSIEYF